MSKRQRLGLCIFISIGSLGNYKFCELHQQYSYSRIEGVDTSGCGKCDFLPLHVHFSQAVADTITVTVNDVEVAYGLSIITKIDSEPSPHSIC